MCFLQNQEFHTGSQLVVSWLKISTLWINQVINHLNLFNYIVLLWVYISKSIKGYKSSKFSDPLVHFFVIWRQSLDPYGLVKAALSPACL